MKSHRSLVALAFLTACVSTNSTPVSGPAGPRGSSTNRNDASGGASSSGGTTHASSFADTSTGSSSGAASASSSSTGTLASSSGSSSGGSSGESSGADGNCQSIATLPDGGGCPNGAFVSQVLDLFTCLPIAGATVQALDARGAPVSGSVNTAADGTFVLCAPPQSAFTPFVSASTYSTIYYPELRAGLYYTRTYVDMISASDLTVLSALLPGGFNASDGTIFAQVHASASCPDQSGWYLELTGTDGGAIADGGYLQAFTGTSGLPVTGTVTTSTGAALFYDIDLTATNFFDVQASKPDAGACGDLELTADYTGRLYVTVNALSSITFEVQ